jgi:CxxC-x17-CxxC domain-containing protein
MSYQDKELTCVECNAIFTFSADDQQFHADKGYTEPRRCPACRAARRAGRDGGYSSGSFGDSSYGSGGSYRAPREMHPAVCAQCNKDTEVPFLPRGDKPVYCSDCFSKRPQTSRSW